MQFASLRNSGKLPHSQRCAALWCTLLVSCTLRVARAMQWPGDAGQWINQQTQQAAMRDWTQARHRAGLEGPHAVCYDLTLDLGGGDGGGDGGGGGGGKTVAPLLAAEDEDAAALLPTNGDDAALALASALTH